MAMSSPNMTLRTSEDANSWVSLVSGLQKDRKHSKGDSASSSTSELVDGVTTVKDLPEEVMLKIFSYMSFSENINILQRVCTRWKNLAQDPQMWYHKPYVFRYNTSEEEAVATFAAVPQLRSVILEKEVSPRFFEALQGSCPHLTNLKTGPRQELTYSEATNLFDGCKEIHTLTISEKGQRADARFMDAVARLVNLRVLHIQRCECMDLEIPLHALANGCPHLCDLDLESLCYKIQDAEYFITSHRHVLKRLCIRWTSVEGRSVTVLLPACAKTLKCLELNEYAVRDEEATDAFTALGKLHSLQKLQLGFTNVGIRHLLPAMFRNGELSKLQHLSLYGTVVDDTTRAISKQCPELRELSLWGCKEHTDVLFEPLHRLEKLEILNIYSCKCLNGKAMSYIAKLRALHTLHFAYTKFERLQPSVDCILEMSGLRRLYLMESICWDIPFDKFPGRLVNLRELEIKYCDGDSWVLDRIRAQMPNLRVEGSLGAIFTTSEEDD